MELLPQANRGLRLKGPDPHPGQTVLRVPRLLVYLDEGQQSSPGLDCPEYPHSAHHSTRPSARLHLPQAAIRRGGQSRGFRRASTLRSPKSHPSPPYLGLVPHSSLTSFHLPLPMYKIKDTCVQK